MNFNINLGKLFQIAGMGNDKHKIDTASEIKEVNSIFANTQSAATNPIGDSVQFSKKPSQSVNNINSSAAEKLANIAEQEPGFNVTSFRSYMDKPLTSWKDSFEFDLPYSIEAMSEMAENVDVDKLNAYLAAACNDPEVMERLDDFAIEFEVNGGDDKNAQVAYTVGALYEIGALEVEDEQQ